MKLASKSAIKTDACSQLKAAQWRAILQQKETELEKSNAKLEKSNAELETKDAIIAHLNIQLTQIVADRDTYKTLADELLRLGKIQRFAASSEKSPYQIDLFDEAELDAAIDDLCEQVLDADKADHQDQLTLPPKPKTRQRGFAASLKRIRREFCLSEAEKAGASKTFFTKVKEELEYIPAQLNVIEIWQEKAVFKQGSEEHLVAAQRPVHPLGKCLASTSLLAYIITSKYTDGLPLYRLDGMIKRLGHDIGRSNMAHWVVRLENVFNPLINLMREQQNTGHYIQADETRIQVLKQTGKTVQSDKWMWVTRGGPLGKPTVLFEYDPSRAGDVITRLLDDFRGILQTDGYAGYARLCEETHIQRIRCWDHARRKFIEASKAAAPGAKKTKKGIVSKADVAIGKIRKLYAIERKIADLSDEEKYQVRQTLSKPALNEFKQWLITHKPKVLKGSLTDKAIRYTLNQWDCLTGYCEHGHVHISNVLAENAIRPFAVGRKAWLFADTTRGAHASATCYSLIETAKANNLEPYAYLLHLLNHIGAADTLEKIEALLPWNVAQGISQK